METIATIPHAVASYYDRTLLERALPLLVHTRFAQIRDIPKNGGNVVTFRKYAALAVATTPLTEAVTPAASTLSVSDITATVVQYGAYVAISDFLQMTTLDPVLMETAAILGEQAGLTLDTLCRDVMVAGTNYRRTASRTNRTDIVAGDVILAADIDAVVLTLKTANTAKWTGMVSANPGYATAPIREAYIGINHPMITAKLQGMTGWNGVEKYADRTAIYDGEIGSYKEVRFMETTNAKIFAAGGGGGIDVYATLILGKNAYGISRISGESLVNIVKPLGSGGTEDPLNQRSTSGWKATFVAKILQQAFMVRIEHAQV